MHYLNTHTYSTQYIYYVFTNITFQVDNIKTFRTWKQSIMKNQETTWIFYLDMGLE